MFASRIRPATHLSQTRFLASAWKTKHQVPHLFVRFGHKAGSEGIRFVARDLYPKNEICAVTRRGKDPGPRQDLMYGWYGRENQSTNTETTRRGLFRFCAATYSAVNLAFTRSKIRMNGQTSCGVFAPRLKCFNCTHNKTVQTIWLQRR